LLLDVRMGHPEHDVDGVRMPREDRRHRVDHVLDSLVRREETEREDDRAAFDAELVLAPSIRDERNAMGDDVDLPGVDAMNRAEERCPVAAHHYEALGE